MQKTPTDRPDFDWSKIKIVFPLALLNKDKSPHVAFIERLPYKLGVIASQGKGIPTLSDPFSDGPDILVVQGVYGPLIKEFIDKSATRDSLEDRFGGQPLIRGPEAHELYDKLWPNASLFFVTDHRILSQQGWFEALMFSNKERLLDLWKAVCREEGMPETTPPDYMTNPKPPLSYHGLENPAPRVSKEEYNEIMRKSWKGKGSDD